MTEYQESRQELAAEILDAFGVDVTYRFKDESTKNIRARFLKNQVVDVGDNVQTLDLVIGISEFDIPKPLAKESVLYDGFKYGLGQRVELDSVLMGYAATKSKISL